MLSAIGICDKELENQNFEQLQAGTLFATKNSDKHGILNVKSESSEDVCDEFLELQDGKLYLKKPVTMSMFTTDETAIRQDCICYFMEEIHIG